MPGLNGYDICKAIRKESEIPILFLTARDLEHDQVKGLLIGADDYITKPFSLEILYARIFAHLSKQKRQIPSVQKGFHMDYGKREFKIDEKMIILTKTEFDILELLSTHPHLVFDKEKIYTNLWGNDAIGDNTVVAEHVRNLRKKVSSYTNEEFIRTVWGVGYKWIG